MALLLNPETGHVSPELHVLFDEKISTFPFMMEGTITPNWTDIMHQGSQRGALENIGFKDTWFTPDPENDLRKIQYMNRASFQMQKIKIKF